MSKNMNSELFELSDAGTVAMLEELQVIMCKLSIDICLHMG